MMWVMERRYMPLAVSADGPHEVVARVSNDRTPDFYGTRITAEALTDWISGFLQHRFVNLEHRQNRPAGYAVEVDLAPDLIIRVKLTAPEAREALSRGEITGASLEFVPLEWYEDEDGSVVYTRISGEPELTGVGLVARPAVPGATILEARGILPPWAYAVIDPVVWERGMGIEEATQYMYFPHHRPDRWVDPEAVREALERVHARAFEVAPNGTLSLEEVAARAVAHLERHYRYGILVRSEEVDRVLTRGVVPSDPPTYRLDEDSDWEAPSLSDFTDRAWDELTREERIAIAQHYAWAPQMPPERFSDLKLPHHDPKTHAVVWRGVVAAMAALLGARGGVDIPEEDRRRVYAHLARHYREFGKEPPEFRAASEEEEQTMERNEQVQEQVGAAPAEGAQVAAPEQGHLEARGALTPDDMRRIVAEAVAQAMAQANPPRHSPQVRGVGPIPHVEVRAMDRRELVNEVLYRAIGAMVFGQNSPEDLQRLENIMLAGGMSTRAITLTGNTAVIHTEIAREIWQAPELEFIWRNHYQPRPMPGVKKLTNPVFEGNITTTWNRDQGTGTIPESTATHRQFDVEVYPLEAAASLAREFEVFNILGPSWVQEVFLPAIRRALQRAEDNNFFGGAAPLSGLLTVSGATTTTIAASSNPTPLTILRRALRALPAEFKQNRTDLAIYARADIVDGALDEIAARQTALGDAVIVNGPDTMVPGPTPALRVSGVNVYYAAPLDAHADATLKAVAVNRRYAVYAAEGATLEIRQVPMPHFITRFELQEWVGWAFPFPTAIARVYVS